MALRSRIRAHLHDELLMRGLAVKVARTIGRGLAGALLGALAGYVWAYLTTQDGYPSFQSYFSRVALPWIIAFAVVGGVLGALIEWIGPPAPTPPEEMPTAVPCTASGRYRQCDAAAIWDGRGLCSDCGRQVAVDSSKIKLCRSPSGGEGFATRV